MAFIPQPVIDEVIARNDIVSVVQQYVNLEKKGSQNWFGLCPFHAEKTPSFSVNAGKNFFYCFGCHEGGNVIKFIQLVEGLTFPQAVAFLAKRVGIELELEDEPEARRRQAQYKKMEHCLLDAARFFYHSYKSRDGRKADRYLRTERKLSPAIITRFGLGYADPAWESLTRHLQQKGYEDKLLLDLGLSRKSQQGNLYDFYRDRLMFPIFDHLNTLRAFGGRTMGDDQAKYINSPDSLIYNKGKYLFALNFARKSRKGYLILCEGYMDAISLHEAGFDNAVAGLGTALTAEQAKLAGQYTDHVVLAYDSDAAGQRAALAALPLLERAGLDCRVLLLPGSKDPDEYLHSYGRERFEAVVQRALPALDFRLYLAKMESTSELGSLDVLSYQDKATDILSRETNAVVRELYMDKLAADLKISPASILQVVEQKRRGEKPLERVIEQTRGKAQKQSSFPLDKATLTYFIALLEDNQLVKHAETRPELTDFPEAVRPLWEACLGRAEAGQFTMPVFLQLLSDKAPELGLEQKILPYFARLRQSELLEPEALALKALKGLRIKSLQEQKESLFASLRETSDRASKKSILQQIDRINKNINRIHNEVEDDQNTSQE